MFAKHLPPSAELPRVLALDEAAAAELPPEVELTRGDASTPGTFDAVVGRAAPARLATLRERLRPGGRLILAHRADPQSLLAALAAAGFIHCLVEPLDDFVLYRGERPPEGASVGRVQTLATQSPISNLRSPFVFLLITQTPNKPAWNLAPDEKVEWRAATMIDPETGRPALLAFSSLVKAVGFMQASVLTRFLSGVNKIGKFRAEAARAWERPLILNPELEGARSLTLGPAYAVDPQTAVVGDE